uniref:Cyclin N-terminal domain-containing protein n=1 Tax=Tetradesmus obliquus TaxID=3088 RepID=A0A383WE76_TETOB|eukprot:jgi/Sobl393_1/12605/SZX75232.1
MYPQTGAFSQPPASKWEQEAGTCPSSSSCVASESCVCLPGSQCSEGCLQQQDAAGIYSTEAFSLEESSCAYQECGSTSGQTQWRGDFPEQTGRLELLQMIRCQMDVEQEVHPPRQFLDPHRQAAAAGSSDFLTPGMRMIVASWMVEVAEEFRLQQETLHLATGLLDRFLSSTQDVPRCVLQLLAVACMMLAAKDLEVVQPTVEQFCAVTANHFKRQDLLRMERIVLDVLEFRLSSPSSYTFLHLLAQACSHCVTPSVLSLAMYVCELAVLEYDMHQYPHSTRAGAALLLSQLSLGAAAHLPNVASVVAALGIPVDELAGCMESLLSLQKAAFQHTLAAAAAAAGCGAAAQSCEVGDLLAPLRTKYGHACWCDVSGVPPIAALPPAYVWAAY